MDAILRILDHAASNKALEAAELKGVVIGIKYSSDEIRKYQRKISDQPLPSPKVSGLGHTDRPATGVNRGKSWAARARQDEVAGPIRETLRERDTEWTSLVQLRTALKLRGIHRNSASIRAILRREIRGGVVEYDSATDRYRRIPLMRVIA